MRTKLEVLTRDENGSRILSIRGEVDMESSPRVLEAIRAGLGRASSLKLDLGGVSYIDSSGIAVLIQGLKIARRDDPEYSYVLRNVSQQVMSVIELSQLKDLFDFETSGEEG